jgi:ArsR family transcriptional regulator
LVRLSALADDTRLQILDLLAVEGELRAQDIIDRLGISQSSASRHLSQLAATGYLHVHRCEGAKCYSLKRERIDDTLGDLKRYLGAR